MCYMFVENAQPISCPDVLQKPLTFEYDSGYGHCDTPTNSRVSTCASNKKLRLNFNECPVLSYEYPATGMRQTH